jgi:ATP-dependent Clp protease ATP-binding subunit ClpA
MDKLASTAIDEILRLNQRFSPYSGLPGKPIRFLETMLMNQRNTLSDKAIVINRKEVIKRFSEESGLPLFMIDPDIPMDIPAIKSKFNTNIYGQENAVDIVVDKLASVKTALTRTGKPISSFLFVGPTGVGKTELAKVLSKFMFGHENRMIRFDMSEYAGPYAVSRLIGDPGGIEGQLTSAVRQNPFCVLLFDEIEKANPSVYDLFLQILGDGRLTDQLGKVVNFCSSIIILTSNIGAVKMQGNRISWKPGLDSKEVMQFFDTAVQKFFRPELYNRIDQVIPFAPLDKDTMRFVVDREINLLKKLEGIRFKNMNFKIDPSVLDHFSEIGYHPKYGARYLQRSIRDTLTAPLAAALNNFDQEDRLNVDIKMLNGVLKIYTEADPLGVDLFWEALEQITNADYISEIRRMLVSMQEGNTYIRLLNQLDIYEDQRKRQKEAFFADAVKARDYSFLLATKEKVAAFSKKVVDLEQRFDLSVLDMLPYETSMEAELDSCKDEFFDLKLEIYARLHPKVNHCQLGIFGENPIAVFLLYEQILNIKNFDLRVHSVWFRDGWYNEEVPVEDGAGKTSLEKREAYILKEELGSLTKGLKANDPSDILVGLAIDVKGPCAALFLEAEHDIFIEWHPDEKTKYTCLVQVANEELAPPENIHRKAFFSKVLPGRFIQEGHLKDLNLGINREVKKGGHGEWILKGLEEEFKKRVEGIL